MLDSTSLLTMANDKESGAGHQEISTEEKATIYQNELTVDEKGNQTVVDYSGAHEKTDPREIALVRKLDLCKKLRANMSR